MSTPTLPLRDSYEGILQRARIAANRGDLQNAIKLYRHLVERLARLSDRVLARRPELHNFQVQARAELGQVLEMEGRYAEAIEVLEALPELAPDQSDDWRRDLAILRVAKGEVEQGLAELQALANDAPDQVWNWLALGNEARIEGRFRESEAALDRALDVAKEHDPAELDSVHYYRFLLSRDMKSLDEAVDAWQSAATLNPDWNSEIRSVYTMLTDAGRYGQALSFVEEDENELQAGLQRGVIDSLTGNPAKAEQEWQAVAQLDPFAFDYGHDCWAEAVLRIGDLDLALEKLQRLSARYGTPRLLVLSGIAWAMRGDPRLASALFQQAINLLRRSRPPKKKLDKADWDLLDSLVDDNRIKAKLKTLFAVIETPWGSAATKARQEPPSSILRP
ncbi:MAG: tetratricopeptide repeat protein [Anaerolineae bacterium]|jgi:tetratricopeptide (TPR) repeat protein